MILFSKEQLFEESKEIALDFCIKNNLIIPEIKMVDEINLRNGYNASGIYYDNKIFISKNKTAKIGNGFRQWSFPGYKVDRTCYGVVFHELGHHVFRKKNVMNSGIKEWKNCVSITKRITNYEPNLEESFAESFRLFMTNPDYLNKYAHERFNFIVDFLKIKPIIDISLEENNCIEILRKRGADIKWLKATKKSIS